MAEDTAAKTGSGASATSSPPAARATSPTAAGTRPTGPSGPGRLETEKGTTTIADAVVTKVAGIAAREVGGVHRLGGAVSRALGAVTQRLTPGDNPSQGVSVEVSDNTAAVSMTVIVDYGESIPEVAQAIRDNVVRRIEGSVGLIVSAVDITVTDLYFPGDDEDDDSSS